LLTAALMLLGASLILYTLAPQTVGETARRHLLSRLANHYPNHVVSIGRGNFDPHVGLIFEDIRISKPRIDSLLGRADGMIHIERLTLVSVLQAEKLLDQQIPLQTQRVVIEGIRANTWLDDQGRLSIAELWPLPSFGPTVPRVELFDTKLRLIDPATNSRPIDFELASMRIDNRDQDDGTIAMEIMAQGAADFADDLKIRIDHNARTTDVQAKITHAQLSRGLIDRLPTRWSQLAEHARDLQCACDVGLVLRRDAGGQVNYKVKTTVHQGRFNHPQLPLPVSDLRGVFVLDPRGVTINASHGVFGDAVLRAAGRIDGLQWPCDVDLQVSADGLLLDSRLAAALPANVQAAWNKLQPHGQVNLVDTRLRSQQGQWDIRASVDCVAVDVRYEKFPYPLETLVGRIEVAGGIASSQGLSGRIGDSRLQCAFRTPIQASASQEKSFVIRTDGPITIDNEALSALTPRGSPITKQEMFVRSLRPRGAIKLDSAVVVTDAAGRLQRSIVLEVVDGHVNYEKFAYPLGNITGKIEITDDLVQLFGLRASNANSGVVTCEGHFRIPTKGDPPIADRAATGNPGPGLALNFVATDVPMDQSLRSSLPESSRHAWDSISPSGLLDQLTVQVTQQDIDQELKLDIEARQFESEQITNRTLSLRPITLPYRLDVNGGSVQFDGSRVSIRALKGRHDASTLSADGQCVRNADGRWELSLDLHSGSRLHPDAELIAAMPDQLREAMRRLQLRGPVSVRGTTRIQLPDGAHPTPDIAWNLGLQLEGNRIGDVGPVHSLRGEIEVQGVQDVNGPRAVGQVRLDSMHVHDLQITNVVGPFSVIGDRLDIGSESRLNFHTADKSEFATVPVAGKLFDGTIAMNGHCVLSTGNFLVDLTVRDGRVPTALAEFGNGNHGLTGTFQGQTRLQGTLGNMDLLNGSGTAQLSGANLYQLPLIVQVLNLLRITPTEDVAFTDGQVEFVLDGQMMTFNDLQLWGDLVTLQGGGTLHRMREVDLTFNTRVSPQNGFTQIIRPLRSNRYTLWTVDVRGPWHALQIERRALDGVGETLERLFPAMAQSNPETREPQN
jgi:hypothetical protein